MIYQMQESLDKTLIDLGREKLKVIPEYLLYEHQLPHIEF
jgi:hypothetical protein